MAWWRDGERRYAEAAAAMRAVDSPETLARAKQLEAHAPQRREFWLTWGLHLAWLMVTAPLASATFLSLGWLADMKENEQEFVLGIGLAPFCFGAIAAGVAWVTLFPMVVVIVRGWQSLGRRNELRDSIYDLERAAVDRIGVPSQAGESGIQDEA